MQCSDACLAGIQAMPRNKGTCRAHKAGTGIKKSQTAQRIISHVKVKLEHAADTKGGTESSTDHTLDVVGACCSLHVLLHAGFLLHAS